MKQLICNTDVSYDLAIGRRTLSCVKRGSNGEVRYSPVTAAELASDRSSGTFELDGSAPPHNCYVLTAFGCVSRGIGADGLKVFQHDHHIRGLAQCAEEDGSFDCIDKPADTIGATPQGGGRGD